MSKESEPQLSSRSRETRTPTRSATTPRGRALEKSRAASNSPRPTRPATIAAASASRRAATGASAWAPSERISTLRRATCVSPSLNRVVLRAATLVIGLAATPWPLTNSSSSRSAARTSSKRPIAHIRCRGSQTTGPASRIAAKAAAESSITAGA